MSAEPLPRPLVANGTVTIDPRERTLVVKPEGHRAQVQDLQSRTGGMAPTVWAAGAGHDKIAPGLPGDDGTLRFRYSRGDPNYGTMVSTPGLRATFVVDRETSHIMSVRFRGR